MTLCDAGPLIALIDTSDKEHHRCARIVEQIPSPLMTTWPCIAESMYLLGKAGGFQAQDKLWALLDNDSLVLHATTNEERTRMRALMRKYRDTPMDLADASLVAAAEALNVSEIFTLDKHFHAYRIHGTKRFEVVP